MGHNDLYTVLQADQAHTNSQGSKVDNSDVVDRQRKPLVDSHPERKKTTKKKKKTLHIICFIVTQNTSLKS